MIVSAIMLMFSGNIVGFVHARHTDLQVLVILIGRSCHHHIAREQPDQSRVEEEKGEVEEAGDVPLASQ